ncbi:MAG: hypothetical protein RLZZ507_2474 [Cyanobacteriota bacterium]|jgi:WD40 repeat protein/predicted KAP-like P-loop ATPase
MEAPQGQQEISSQQFSIPEIETDLEADQETEKPFAQFESKVNAVAISPQGRTRIAVGLGNGTVEIWDVLTGTKWASCLGHTSSVNSVAFSPDGSMVVSGSLDNTVRLWDAKTGEAIAQPITGHTGSVNSVAFNPDGNTVVSGSKDKTVRLWDVNTGKAIGQLYSHAQPVTSVAFSPDGNTIVSGSWDNTVWLWDLNTEEAIAQTFSGHTKPILSVAFSPDGKTIVSGSWDNTVRLWDIETGEAIGQPFSGHTNSVTSVAFSANGSIVVSGSEDSTVLLWDVKTGEAIGQPFSGHISSVTSVAFSAGSMVVSGSEDRTVRLWDVETATPINQVFSGHIDTVNSVAFSPDGSTVVSGGEDNRVLLWDIKTGKALGQSFSSHTDRHRDIVKSVAFSPDGKTVVSGSSDTTMRLWDVKKRKTIDQPFSGHIDTVTSVAFSPDGSTVVSGSEDITVRLWDVKTGEAIGQPFSGHTNSVTSVAFSPEGNTVVSGSWDKTVRLWDVKTGTPIGQPFFGHTDSVISVAFSADGNTIVSGSLDNTVRLWDVETGTAIGQPFLGHKYLVNSVAFSPDGSSIISGSADKTVRLWDISDPQHKRQIIIGEHQGEVHSVAFDPQGDYIISAGEDGIKVWRWQRFNLRSVPQAFSNDQASGEDALDVAKELQALADVLMLRSLKPPLAVAILGSWGSGKSFGMHLIEKQITKIRCQKLTEKQTWSDDQDDPNLSPYVGHVYQIKFNAWSYAKSDLWASLMQTIFDQLDRQLTLEQQLIKVGEVDPLTGGEIWRVLNQMNDSDRKAILESELSEEVFAQLKSQILDRNKLWEILRQVRQDEQEQLKITEDKLQDLQAEVREINQEIEDEYNQKLEQLEQEFITQEVNRITSNVEQEMTDVSILIVFLSQLKETLKDDLGDSILKDFLHLCNFQSRQDLEKQFPMFQLDKLANSNLIDVAEDLVRNKDEKIQNIVNNADKFTHFLQEQPTKIVSIIEFTKRDRKTLFLFLGATALPFITYFLIIDIIPKVLPILKEISASLQIWLTSVSAIPAISVGVEIFKKVKVLQVKTARFLQAARENVEIEKQNLAKTKEEKIKEEIEQRKEEYKQNQVKEIYSKREEAEKQLVDKQQEIEKLKLQVERQKERIGLTAQYTSLLDFVNKRLDENSYQKLLGIMHQIQDDLQDLSDHLTYIPGHTNPEKRKILKPLFPRGPARIVLYIDDLDRCPPDKVVQVLEAVQLLLNTEIFIVVLAIDDRYIGRALEHNYRGVLKRGGTPSGVDYIEKIIQLPYRMRPISKEVTESYLQSLLDIEEKAKIETPKIAETPKITETLEITETPKITETLEKLNQVKVETAPHERKENQIDKSAAIKKDQDMKKVEKAKYESNTNPLVTVQKFTAEEFQWISECCQHVDLTPRTAKRLINICKIIKIIWTPTENDKKNDTTWKVEPSPECKQSLIAFLALAGRYPREMRKLLEEIYFEFEEEGKVTVELEKNKWIHHLQNLDVFMDRHNQREWKKFKSDFNKMLPKDKFVFEKRTLNLAVSFCFVGDVGYDPDDMYNREYRFEDGKKIYGFHLE